MSADNYNLIIETEDGKWVASPNHSMSDLMSREEYEAYERALGMIRPNDEVYDTQLEAYAALDDLYSEYGTFSHEYREWFEEYE